MTEWLGTSHRTSLFESTLTAGSRHHNVKRWILAISVGTTPADSVHSEQSLESAWKAVCLSVLIGALMQHTTASSIVVATVKAENQPHDRVVAGSEVSKCVWARL